MNNNKPREITSGDKIWLRAPALICVNPPSKPVMAFCRFNKSWRSCCFNFSVGLKNIYCWFLFPIFSTWSTSLFSHGPWFPCPDVFSHLFPAQQLTWEMGASDIERVKYFPDRSWDAWQVCHDPSCYITKHITQLKHIMKINKSYWHQRGSNY